MPLSASFGFFFDQTYQSRYGESGSFARRLEPGVLVRGVVDHQVDQDADAVLLRLVGEVDEVARASPGCGSTP